MTDTGKCPRCKTTTLQLFDSSPTSKTLTCSSCGGIVTVKTVAGKVIEVAAPTIGVLAGAIAIAAFFGLHNIDEVSDWIDGLIG